MPSIPVEDLSILCSQQIWQKVLTGYHSEKHCILWAFIFKYKENSKAGDYDFTYVQTNIEKNAWKAWSFFKSLHIAGKKMHIKTDKHNIVSNVTQQWSNSAIQLSKNEDIYIQSNKLATWQTVMLAFVPISLACKGNTKCQAKYSSNKRIITAAPGTAGGQTWSPHPLFPPKPKQNNNREISGSADEMIALKKHGKTGICKLLLLTESWHARVLTLKHRCVNLSQCLFYSFK